MVKKKLFLLPVLLLNFSVFAQVIFEDNFDGAELNMEYWNYEEGDGCPDLCGWGNNERQSYHRDYVQIEDGKLVITVAKQEGHYYSGKVNTKDKVNFQYGIVEFRAKLPQGKGVWPALWMLGTDINQVSWPASGEIDIMEYVGREPGAIHTTLHTPASYGNTINTRKTMVENIEQGYHTYKAVWTQNNISFYIDDKQVYEFVPQQYDKEHYPFRKPFYILMNMAVGGNLGGQEIDDTALPAKFYIDYVRVTELPSEL